MIKSLPNLYSFLKLSEIGVGSLLENLYYFYTSKKQPKIKYGDYQRDDFGKIKERQLTIPSYVLKSRQKLIAQLLNRIPLPEYLFGSIPAKNNILNARQHVTHKYFLTIDLKDFFSNISHHQVYSIFTRNGFSPSVSSILTKLTTYQSCLPQGVPSSPVIGNLVLEDTCNELFKLAKANKITFTSFLDDLTFSSTHCFKILIPQFINIIKSNGFYPSYKKIHYRKGYCEVTGLFVKGKTLELHYKMAKKAKTNIHLKSYQELVKRYNMFTP
jgi:RNA-directed DNA polymerase